MSRELSNKKIARCQLKGYLERKAKFSIYHRDLSRENCEPMHCKYASEGEVRHDPVCEIVRRRIADLEACPQTTRQSQNNSGHRQGHDDKSATQSLLEGAMWTKTKSGGI